MSGLDAALAPSRTHAAANGNVAIGVDVGGTKIAGALVDLSTGKVHRRLQMPSLATRSGEEVLADVAGVIRQLKADARATGTEPIGAGVAVAELVDPSGNVFSDHRIAWKGLPVRQMLSAEIETHVESDVRAAALGEALYGQGRDFQHFIFVSIGTGISSALVQHGRPYQGSRGAALVIANGVTTHTCPSCGSTTRYVLEDFASGAALVARFNEASGGNADRAEAVLAAAQSGDIAAVEIVESAAAAVGAAIGLLVNSLDPSAVIVGGGLGGAPGLYWERLTMAIHDSLWQDDVRELPILQTKLGLDAGVIGAAASYRGEHSSVRRHLGAARRLIDRGASEASQQGE